VKGGGVGEGGREVGVRVHEHNIFATRK